MKPEHGVKGSNRCSSHVTGRSADDNMPLIVEILDRTGGFDLLLVGRELVVLDLTLGRLVRRKIFIFSVAVVFLQRCQNHVANVGQIPRTCFICGKMEDLIIALQRGLCSSDFEGGFVGRLIVVVAPEVFQSVTDSVTPSISYALAELALLSLG